MYIEKLKSGELKPSIGSKFFSPPSMSGTTFDIAGQYVWKLGRETETVHLKDGGIATFILEKEGSWEYYGKGLIRINRGDDVLTAEILDSGL